MFCSKVTNAIRSFTELVFSERWSKGSDKGLYFCLSPFLFKVVVVGDDQDLQLCSGEAGRLQGSNQKSMKEVRDEVAD